MEYTNLILPVALSIIMLGIGTRLSFKDFNRVFVKPKPVLTGVFSQIVLLPLIAFAIAYLSPVDPIYKAGLVLIAACPGGTSSNLVTYLLKGKTALSVSMTSLNSFVILISLPLIVGWGLDLFESQKGEIALPFWETARKVLITVIIPVSAGVIINHFRSDLSEKIKKPLKYILPGILLLTFIYVIFFSENSKSGDIFSNERLILFIPCLILNIAAMLTGYYSGRVMGFDNRYRYTFAIEVGLQNSALAIYVAHELIGNYDLAVIAVIYSSFTFFSTLAIAYWMKTKWA